MPGLQILHDALHCDNQPAIGGWAPCRDAMIAEWFVVVVECHKLRYVSRSSPCPIIEVLHICSFVGRQGNGGLQGGCRGNCRDYATNEQKPALINKSAKKTDRSYFNKR